MSTRQGRSQATSGRDRRQQRRENRGRYQRQKRNKRIVAALSGLVVAGIVAAIVYNIVQDRRDESLIASAQTYDVVRDHVTDPVNYEQTPPVGGPHFSAWQNCGYYPSPVRNEHAVHSLEHGAVWITYHPDLPADQVATLRAKAEQSYVLVSPYPDLPSPVVASAWGVQLPMESAADGALDAFLRQYRQGPQTPEPGAACTGGISVAL